MRMMDKKEKQFYEIMQAKKLTLHFEPMSFEIKNYKKRRANSKKASHYIPDFYCEENKTYYEVIGTRQRYSQNKDKLKQFLKHYTLKIVNPDSSDYAIWGTPAHDFLKE